MAELSPGTGPIIAPVPPRHEHLARLKERLKPRPKERDAVSELTAGKPEPLESHIERVDPKIERAKEKKLAKEPEPMLWKEKAEFLPATASFLEHCGIDPKRVNPTPLGQGLTHIVFAYYPPEGDMKVVKIPRNTSVGFMSTGYHEDLDNVQLVQKYFGEHSVPTDIRLDTTTGRYLYVQDAVKGKSVTSLTESQNIRTQIADLARMNREMMRQKNVAMDFLGVPGFLTLLRHQFWSIISKKSHFELSNIMEDQNGKLKLIDVGLIRFDHVPFKQWLVSQVGFFVNRMIMRLYFGVDIKPKQ